jgi:histidinol-phosphatase (PHP family)
MKKSSVEKYYQDIARIKIKYKNRIDVYIGTEVDYIFSSQADRSYFEEKSRMLDYTIGAVHCFYDIKTHKLFYFDGSTEQRKETLLFFNSPKRFCHGYYSRLCHLINIYKPDIVAHLDVIKKNNHLDEIFDVKKIWYQRMVLQALDKICKAGVIVEVNLGGITRGYTCETYPSYWILKECLRRNIPIVLSSDAHNISGLTSGFEEAIYQLINIGYKGQMSLNQGKWEFTYF